MKEVKQVLKDIAWRGTEGSSWGAAKAGSDGEFKGCQMHGALCGNIVYKMERRMMVKLRGGTAELWVETGRWCGLSRGERLCKNCDNGEVEGHSMEGSERSMEGSS